MMVEVFKTNISKVTNAKRIARELEAHFPESYVNFDLEDCDNILRIVNCSVQTHQVIQILNRHGYDCQVLE